ncbi:MAG: hypothetical protein J5819_01565 [Eubacterium sp.]|nr:hypothetical protein [Eubacterium sp.]
MREDKFLNAYPEAEKLNIPCDVSGFGKGSVPCSVYRIPEFKLNDGNTSYLIFNLVLAVYENPKIGCDIVLSDTMFSKTNTVIQRIGDKALRIEFEKDGYYCTPMINGKSIAITTWVQEGQ